MPRGPQHPLDGPGVSANSDRVNPSAMPAGVNVRAAWAEWDWAAITAATIAAGNEKREIIRIERLLLPLPERPGATLNLQSAMSNLRASNERAGDTKSYQKRPFRNLHAVKFTDSTL